METEPERHQQRIKEHYVDLFSTPAGQEVLKDLRIFCGMDEPASVLDAPDGMMAAMLTYRNDGMTNVVRYIEQQMRTINDQQQGETIDDRDTKDE